MNPRLTLRTRWLALLTLTTLLTLAISLSLYRKMLIEMPAFAWLAGATLAAGVASAAVVYVFTRPLLRRIEALAAAARRIAAGDLSTRVPVDTRDELLVLATAFNQMAAEIESLFTERARAQAAQRQLIADVSHDLRTPLSAIASLVEALRDDVVADPATRRRYLQTISQESAYMGRLIRDLADLAQLESEHFRLEPAAIDLEGMLAEILESFGPQLDRLDGRFFVEIAPASPPLAADPLRLRQAVTNVVQNAVQVTPQGGTISVRVEARPRPAGPVLRLSVSDEGPGVPAQIGERIFERFVRADSARSRTPESGLGLGLAIARDIARLHGGSVGLENLPGRGACIWLEFPTSGVRGPSDAA